MNKAEKLGKRHCENNESRATWPNVESFNSSSADINLDDKQVELEYKSGSFNRFHAMIQR